jgi:hypothetical protein
MDYEITLPTLHADQLKVYRMPGRFKAVRCGRRWGKTVYGEVEAIAPTLRGYPVGWFAPDYKILSETYHEIKDILSPLIVSSSRIDGVIRLITGGRIDFWTLENERAGRSRKYKKVVIDEAAFGKTNVFHIWKTSIRPTLIDLRGSALVLSNTNGADPENFLWRICNEEKHGFVQYHAPSQSNPYLDPAEFEQIKAESHPLVYQQEILAEFVDWSGVAFFSIDKLLEDGQPIAYPAMCDGVFAIIDTAVKAGAGNDGTAVTYFALSRHFGTPLVILDWDIMQIEGDLLINWLPSVAQRLEELSRLCGARMGNLGILIEDAASGHILINQAQRQDIAAQSIDSRLTAMGKDERALDVSGYVHNGKVKLSRHAYDKTTVFKGQSRNHLVSQVTGFRLGDKKAASRADDLLDTFTYGIALSLGDHTGM